jgi:hypothetical protein
VAIEDLEPSLAAADGDRLEDAVLGDRPLERRVGLCPDVRTVVELVELNIEQLAR